MPMLQGYDVMEEMYNEKTAAMNFVHELCKERPKGNLETFMTLCIGVMNEYQVTGVKYMLFMCYQKKITNVFFTCLTQCQSYSDSGDCACGVQAAGTHPTREQCRRMDGAFLAIGALNDVLKGTVGDAFLPTVLKCCGDEQWYVEVETYWSTGTAEVFTVLPWHTWAHLCC